MEPQLNTIWALTDFTKENGATHVVPGSQNWPDSRRPRPSDFAYAEMERGSALVYTGSVFHCGGANTSKGDRIGMNLTYCLGWLRQEENQYFSCPPEVARTLEPELQQLMGYATGGYGLGFYTPPTPVSEGSDCYPIEHAVGLSR
jgi:ectoine hydroxylase-related dioxygenase (phytanoyl-CoA dioxygenase family)